MLACTLKDVSTCTCTKPPACMRLPMGVHACMRSDEMAWSASASLCLQPTLLAMGTDRVAPYVCCPQFERTLIIAEDDSQVSYLEGCTAPSYDSNQVRSCILRTPVVSG